MTEFAVAQLTGNITSSTQSGCTTAQTINVVFQQAASGGPFTVVMPTGFDACLISPTTNLYTTCSYTWDATASLGHLNGSPTSSATTTVYSQVAEGTACTPTLGGCMYPDSTDHDQEFINSSAVAFAMAKKSGTNDYAPVTGIVSAHNGIPFAVGTGGGTAQVQTATFSPAVPSLSDGMSLCWLPSAANTGAAPTFSPSGLTAHSVVKAGGVALVANDIVTTAHACVIYNLAATDWELQNPQTASASSCGVTSIIFGCGLSGGTITTSGNVAINVGIDTQTGSGAFAIPVTDCGKLVKRNNASAVFDTILQAGTGGFTTGWSGSYICLGAGGCTITPAAGTINGAGSLPLTTNQSAKITSDGTNYSAELGAGSGTVGALTNQTFTANGTGVTINLAATKDGSNPSQYQTVSTPGSCGTGIAGSTATSASFALQSTVGQFYTAVADNTVTAGHILVGYVTTPGRFSDSGQTSRTVLSNTTSICGVAQSSAVAGGTFTIKWESPGFGTLINGSAGGSSTATFSSVSSVTVPGVGMQNVVPSCVDSTGNFIGASWSVSGSPPYNVTVTFSGPVSVVLHNSQEEVRPPTADLRSQFAHGATQVLAPSRPAGRLRLGL